MIPIWASDTGFTDVETRIIRVLGSGAIKLENSEFTPQTLLAPPVSKYVIMNGSGAVSAGLFVDFEMFSRRVEDRD
jgi:hypothetical protein